MADTMLEPNPTTGDVDLTGLGGDDFGIPRRGPGRPPRIANPTGAPPALVPGSARDLLRSKAATAEPTDTVEEFADNTTRETNANVRVARSGFGRLPVYVLTPAGVVRREINVQSINEVLMQPTYSATCFDCGSDRCSGTVNGCAGRPQRKYRVCPVRSCSKPIYDTLPTGKFLADEFDHGDRRDQGDDPNVIRDDYLTGSTPEARTKAAMDLHIIAFHQTTAMEMGIGRPAEMPRLAVVS